MTLKTMRDNLKTALSAISGWNGFGLTQNFDTPALLVYPRGPFDWHDVFVAGDSTHRTAEFVVEALVSATDLDKGEDFLLGALDTIVAAIESVTNAGVTAFLSYGIEMGPDGTEYLAARWSVEYLA